MSTSADTPIARASSWLTNAAAFGAMVIGLVVLVGWKFDLAALKSVLPGWGSMKANAALGFMLSGLSLMLAQTETLTPGRRRLARVGAWVVVALGLATLGEDAFDRNWGIDELLFRDNGVIIPPALPGRMAPNAALCFILTGAAVLLRVTRRPQERRKSIIGGLGVMVAGFGAFSMAGYICDVALGFRWWNFAGMAVHTAGAFVLLGLGLLGMVTPKHSGRWVLGHSTTGYFLMVAVLLLGACAMTYTTIHSFSETTSSIAHTHRIHSKIVDVKAAVGEAVAAQRAFILTDEQRFWADCHAALGRALNLLPELTRLASDFPEQQRSLLEVSRLVQGLALGMNSGATRVEQTRAARDGREAYEQTLRLLDAMSTEQEGLLEVRERQSTRHSDLALLFIPTGTFISLLVLGAVLVGLNREVGERRRAEESLVAERTLLRTLIDLLPDYIYVKDADSRFLVCNAAGARRLGVTTTQELIGRTDVDFFPPETAAGFRIEERAVLAGTPTIDREEEFTRPDGIHEVILTSKVPLRQGDGKITGIVGTGRDITERKRAEDAIHRLNADLERRVTERTAQLEAANRELEAFSYSVSHDLRAPLRAMDGYADAVITEFGPTLPDHGRRYLDTIRAEARRMADLIDALLEFSRLGRLPLRRQPVLTGKLVRDALAELRADQEARAVEIRIGDLPPCQGDPVLLKQVWLNLLSNALKYTLKCPEPVIEIGSTTRDGEHTYFVRDNGAGFDMRYAEKLFGVFQRLHHAEDFEGTGVGLAIVQQVIQRHGGRVWAEAAVGLGACFYFTLEGSKHGHAS